MELRENRTEQIAEFSARFKENPSIIFQRLQADRLHKNIKLKLLLNWGSWTDVVAFA